MLHTLEAESVFGVVSIKHHTLVHHTIEKNNIAVLSFVLSEFSGLGTSPFLSSTIRHSYVKVTFEKANR